MAGPTFNEVMCMKRSELQTLCKGIDGVKANGKTEALQAAIIRHFKLVDMDSKGDSAAKARAAETEIISSGAKAPTIKKRQSRKDLAPDLSAVQEEDDEKRLGPRRRAADDAGDGAGQTNIVYATSPNTRKTVADLVETVKALQSELVATRDHLKKVLARDTSAMMPPVSPAGESVESVVERVRRNLHDEWTVTMGDRIAVIEHAVNRGTKSVSAEVDGLRTETAESLNSITTKQDEMVRRLESLETHFSGPKSQDISLEPLVCPAQQVRPEKTGSPALSDAPPVCSLLGGADSPRMQCPATPAPAHLQASPTLSLSLRHSGRKMSSADDTANVTAASALPSHMVPERTPSRQPIPRAASAGGEQAWSPARPASRMIGKHARDSDASELSVNVEIIRSPPLHQQRPITPLRRTPKSVTRHSTSGHSRKRMRVSSVSMHEDGISTEPVVSEQCGGGEVPSFEDSSKMLCTGTVEDGFATTSGDYVVKTKTGDEDEIERPLRTVAHKSPRSSLADPTFFAQDAFVPTRSPGGPRKSLPLAALPIPLLSPFVPRTTNVDHAVTPKLSSRKPSLFGASASKTMSASRRSRSQGPAPPTPPAFKTMYGTERGAGYGDLNEGAGPRFDDYAEEPVSVRKSLTWGAELFANASMF
ncbi:hypothetical protein OIV83_000158 [Microbotryomycetes sp. JL201]|nr:hypothetical protein OIV83_000158 [Microbotryomycetes sp. JL201]